MSEEVNEIIELVEEAKKPGTFNILNALKDRAYPRADVTVYLDEQSAYLASQMDESIAAAEKILDSDGDSNGLEAKVERLKSERSELLKKLEDSAYVFTITGISEGKREDILKECEEKFPVSYEETKNPLTGEINRSEILDENRIEHMMNLLWQAHITKISAPNGDVQESVSVNDISEIRRALPIASSAIVNQTIEKVRTATAVFMLSVDEDFLAKS